MGAGGEDKVLGREFAFADGDGVRVEKSGEAFDTDEAGFFEIFGAVGGAGLDDGFHLVGDDAGKANADAFAADLWLA